MAVEKENKDNLELALDTITKKFGKGSVMRGDTFVDIERISTGSLMLDKATGGGFPRGRIVEIYGAESSGKTTICIHAMIEAQKKHPKKSVAIIDAENAFDGSYAKKLGLNMEELIWSQPSSGEEALDIAEELIKSGAMSMVVVDSVAALTPQAEIDGDMGELKMGLLARLMSQAMRKLTAVVNKTNTTLLLINQTREKIGVMFGSPITTVGGNAVKFASSIRIEVNKTKGEDDSNGDRVTSHVKCSVIKNKVSPPFRKAEFDILFGVGIDKVGEIIDEAMSFNIVQKKGAWFNYGDIKLGQGKGNTRTLLNDNPELLEEILNKIKDEYGEK